jgi:ribosomal protein S12 methylthiotransferase
MQNKKINIVTLGCSKNVVDSEKLMKQLQSGGYDIVCDSNDTSASIVLINTCGFINDAKEESIDAIMRFVKAKEAGNIESLYVMGCLSERYMNALKNEIPEVSKYFGVNNLKEIIAELDVSIKENLLSDRTLTGPGHYAYLKVSEGCDRTCAFCAIPLIRGKYRSRPIESLVEEAIILAQKGVKELILIAQDLSYYGLDLYKSQRLAELLTELLKIESFEWIRLHYLYPSNFPLEIVQMINKNPRICKYIDIPIQHITDNMLNLMKRTHKRLETENLLTMLRNEIPGVVIRTTLIAGHPGETESDFRELKDYISKFKFDRLGVFAYSHEEDTYAFDSYNDDVSESVKEERVSELMEIQQQISAELNSSKIGNVFKVIIDRREGEYFVGRTEFDSPEVDQEILVLNECQLNIGQFYNIRVTKSAEFDLYGCLAD